jgi:hypothetical protein
MSSQYNVSTLKPSCYSFELWKIAKAVQVTSQAKTFIEDQVKNYFPGSSNISTASSATLVRIKKN